MGCSLCDLPTPDPPVTGDGDDGTFCCRGCLAVARRLNDIDTDGATETTGEGPADEQTLTDASPEAVLDTGDPDSEGETAFFAVEGMHCSTCEAFLEATATDHPAVANARASYPTGTVQLTYDADVVDGDDLVEVLDGSGYTARPVDEDAPDEDGPAVRLLVGGFFGMMTMLWYVLFLYPAYLGLPSEALLLDVHGSAGRYVLANILVMTAVVLGYTGFPILRGAVVSLRARRPNMDLLVALAAGTAFTYSTLALLLGRVEVYFDIAVVVVLVVSLGEYYKRRITDRATAALTDLTREQVAEARRRTGNGVETVAVEALSGGDEVVVRAGERLPLDGTVVEGEATVDASLVTGEAVPERREPGDAVVGGAVVSAGALVVCVDDAADSTLDRVVRRLWTIQSASPGVQRLADRIALVFVPLVVALAAGAALLHVLLGADPVGAMLTGLAVLIVSCPCALGLATPLSVATATREALARGVAVLDESVFERAPAVDVVAVDKTGTLTTGVMSVRRVHRPDSTQGVATDGGRDDAAGAAREGTHPARRGGPPAGVESDGAEHTVATSGVGQTRECGNTADGGVTAGPGERELLARAAALEQFADHPVAEGIVDAAGAVDRTVRDLSVRPGLGVAGEVDGVPTAVGHQDLLVETGMSVPGDLAEQARVARQDGDVPVLVGWAGRARGLVVAGDEVRQEAGEALSALADGCEVVLLTGDDSGAAARFREHEAVDEVFAGVPPEGKAALVERLAERRSVAMVGDGTNDAPALAAADVGIALGSGTALAAEAADVVVTRPDIGRVADVFGLVRAARGRIRANLGWAFGYNAIAVPLAAAGILNPLLAAVAMSASSLVVVANSARSLDG